MEYMHLVIFGDFHYTKGLLLVVVNCHTHIYMWILDAGNYVIKFMSLYTVVYQPTWKLASKEAEKDLWWMLQQH